MAGNVADLVAMAPATARFLQTPAFLAVLVVSAVVTLLLYAEHPRVSRRTVVAFLPWMVVGAALSVLATAETYPALVRPAVTGIGAYLTTYIVVSLVWFGYLQFARGNRQGNQLSTYLGAMGIGAASVVVGSVLVSAGDLSAGQVFWLAITPIAAAAVAGILLVVIGLWYPEAAAYTGLAGGLAVFGHAFAAIATAVTVVANGGHSTLSWAVLSLVSTVSATGMVGFDSQFVWASGFVWVKLVLVTLAVVALTTYTQRHPSRGNVALGLVGAVGVVSGATALLSLVVGV